MGIGIFLFLIQKSPSSNEGDVKSKIKLLPVTEKP